ncbi:MAG: family 10 glycosylhydrolase [Chitinophagaceae bacterium]|nr:family 10 glycosylhydrolase [Chitinophagaceae bacterium]
MKLALLIAAIVISNFISTAQTPPKRELRGAWIATYVNLDWPANSSQTPDQERAGFISLLNTLQQTGINAVYVQIRSECDAMYASSLEPWSASLTGTQGTPPSPLYDPLQFMITECRARGIEFHAWLNPFRAINNFNNISNFASNHIAKLRPEWLLAQGTYRILDPGIPAVRDYVISVVMDVVRRYDVDGIHFDDYFYPYPSQGGSPAPPRFNDDVTFATYPNGFTNQNDWRRNNINVFVQRTYDSIKNAKPWVKFGIAPFGIWRNSSSDPVNGSATNGLQSYSDIFADTRYWLQNGLPDYVTPQVYWSIGFSVANYGILTPWWNNNAFGRHIYIGHAAYKINADADANWANPSQINNQIRLNRQQQNVFGSTFFRTGNIIANPLFFRDSLVQYMYTKPALLPTMNWRDNTAPQPASNLSATVTGNNVQLNWTKTPATSNELDKARQYVVYRFNTATIDVNDVNAVQFITPNDINASYTDNNLFPGTYYYVVTALDRFHNESVVSNTATATVLATSVTSPELRALNLRNYPNPFRSSTQISFDLLKPMNVSIKLFDMNGREVMQLMNSYLMAGKQTLMFNAEKLLPGVYYITMQTKEFKKTIQVMVMR